MVFKKKKGQEEPVSLFLPNHSLCSGLKKEKVVKSLEQGSMCLKGLSFLFVCVSFCPNGEPKSVLIAQTHRQKVIYGPCSWLLLSCSSFYQEHCNLVCVLFPWHSLCAFFIPCSLTTLLMNSLLTYDKVSPFLPFFFCNIVTFFFWYLRKDKTFSVGF